jgi:hypothetical protein
MERRRLPRLPSRGKGTCRPRLPPGPALQRHPELGAPGVHALRARPGSVLALDHHRPARPRLLRAVHTQGYPADRDARRRSSCRPRRGRIGAPAIFATGDCGFIAMPFAATYPDRVASLILHETSPTWRKSDEIRWGKTDEELEEAVNSSCSLDGNWSQKTNPSLTSEADGLPGASGTREYPSLGVAALRTGGGLTGRMFAASCPRYRFRRSCSTGGRTRRSL